MNAAASKHPPREFLQAFGLGKLGDVAAGKVSMHLEICDECKRQVAELSGDSLLGKFRQANASVSTPAPGNTVSPWAPAKQPGPTGVPPELRNNAQYEIIRELGAGGMGVVYLAKNKLMDRLEVLKVISTAMVHKAGALDRFLREIRAAAALSHDNVVKAYSALQFGELLVFAMEYVEGDDLAKVVKSQGPLPIPNACFYARQAALGLQHAHEKNMVHRDIKPHNLILAREGKKHAIKILDFGLAKATSEKKLERGLTGEGRMLGTPDYMAPEQIQDAATADIRADIYSLGCTLYYLLTGGTPFNADSLYDLLHAHQTQEARSVNLVRPEVPMELGAIVAKMMAKDPKKRYQKPIDVAQALAPFFLKAGAKGPAAPPALSVDEATKAKPARPDAPPKHVEAIAPIPIATPVPQATMMAAEPSSLPPAAEEPKAAPMGKSPRRVKPMLLAAVAVGVVFLGLLITCVGGIILRVESKDGTLIIKSDDPNAVVKVTPEGGATLTYGKDRREIQLKPGKYGIELADAKSGLKLSATQFALTADDKKTIEISWEKKLDAPGKVAEASQPDRKAAEYVLSIGGVIRVNGEIDDTKTIADLPKEPFRLTYVDLDGNPKVRNVGLAAFKGCKHLTFLRMARTQVKDEGLAYFKDCKNLEVLFLYDTAITDTGLANFKDCKNLTILWLEGTQLTDAGLANFKNCKKLTDLFLGHTKVGDGGLAHFKDCKSLMKLGLNFANVSDAGLANFSGCKNLKVLSLGETRQVSDAGMIHFKECKDLESIDLSCTNVTDEGLANFKGSKNVNHLRLRNMKVTDVGLANFRDCKNLVGVDLRSLKLTDVGLAQLDFKNVEWLDLSETQVSDKCLARFKDCKKMGILSLHRTKVTSEGVEELMKDLPRCRVLPNAGELALPSTDPDRKAAEYVLSIGGVVRVNGDESDIRVVANLPREAFQLTWVALRDNKQVSDAGLAAFKGCKSLTYLDLWGTKVSDPGLAYFKDCKDLVSLWLRGTQVSDYGLAHFKDCKKLSEISLHRTHVGNAGLANFKDCKNLTILDLGFTQASDSGLAHFKDCKKLTELHLGNTQVRDTGLAYFKDCKNLTSLVLHGTQVGDVGLAYFKDCKKLTVFIVTGTKVTSAVLADLRKALPKCRIE